MKRLLFLTNLKNSDPEEDEFLIHELSSDFDFVVAHPLDCERHLQEVEGVIIRNIWPTHEYADDWRGVIQKIKTSGLKTYNPLTGSGDFRGKSHLVDLYQKGFPVIPSASSTAQITQIPNAEVFWIKPLESCDGVGAKQVTELELRRLDLRDYIIQPYLEFEAEPCLYFIDGKFEYAITMPHRLSDKKFQERAPSEEELAFAKKFVEWNSLAYGIQRVDAIRLQNGELLLTEVEDIAPYLYLLDLSVESRDRVVGSIRQSIKTVFA